MELILGLGTVVGKQILFSSVLDYDDDYYKRKVKEALRIKQTDNFNQDSGLAVNPVWSSLW